MPANVVAVPKGRRPPVAPSNPVPSAAAIQSELESQAFSDKIRKMAAEIADHEATLSELEYSSKKSPDPASANIRVLIQKQRDELNRKKQELMALQGSSNNNLSMDSAANERERRLKQKALERKMGDVLSAPQHSFQREINIQPQHQPVAVREQPSVIPVSKAQQFIQPTVIREPPIINHSPPQYTFNNDLSHYPPQVPVSIPITAAQPNLIPKSGVRDDVSPSFKYQQPLVSQPVQSPPPQQHSFMTNNGNNRSSIQQVPTTGLAIGQSSNNAKSVEEQKKIQRRLELERQIEETKRRKEEEKRKQQEWDLKKEREMREFQPFGKGGAGAPLRNDQGQPVARYDDMKHSPPRQSLPAREPVPLQRHAPSISQNNFVSLGQDSSPSRNPDRAFMTGVAELKRGVIDVNQIQQEQSKKEQQRLEWQRQIEENQRRKEEEKRKQQEWELKKEREMMEFQPFGKGGAGAPLRNDQGQPVARYDDMKHSPPRQSNNLGDHPPQNRIAAQDNFVSLGQNMSPPRGGFMTGVAELKRGVLDVNQIQREQQQKLETRMELTRQMEEANRRKAEAKRKDAEFELQKEEEARQLAQKDNSSPYKPSIRGPSRLDDKPLGNAPRVKEVPAQAFVMPRELPSTVPPVRDAPQPLPTAVHSQPSHNQVHNFPPPPTQVNVPPAVFNNHPPEHLPSAYNYPPQNYPPTGYPPPQGHFPPPHYPHYPPHYPPPHAHQMPFPTSVTSSVEGQRRGSVSSDPEVRQQLEEQKNLMKGIQEQLEVLMQKESRESSRVSVSSSMGTHVPSSLVNAALQPPVSVPKTNSSQPVTDDLFELRQMLMQVQEKKSDVAVRVAPPPRESSPPLPKKKPVEVPVKSALPDQVMMSLDTCSTFVYPDSRPPTARNPSSRPVHSRPSSSDSVNSTLLLRDQIRRVDRENKMKIDLLNSLEQGQDASLTQLSKQFTLKGSDYTQRPLTACTDLNMSLQVDTSFVYDT
ncbi:hypothetical protein RCL1_003858 [Eukaryota sp. TZLM3-RCL]